MSFVMPNYKGFVKKPPDINNSKKPIVDTEGFQEVRPKKRVKLKRKDTINSISSDENMYDALPNGSDADEVIVQNSAKKKKEPKPPPITVTELNISEVFGECNKLSLNTTNIRFVITRDGIKINCQLIEDFEKIKKHLIETNNKFFTHLLKSQIQTKLVLYGLPNMEVAEIKTKLLEHNLEPAEIKLMNIRSPKYNDQCHYLLYFEKSKNVKISDVREIKSLFYIGVKWEYFSKRNLGPTQCGNCLKFGHGSKDCHLESNCIKCGNPHKSAECTFNLPVKNKDEKPKIPKNKIKCVNCWGDHTANFSGCPARLQYIARIDSIRQRGRNVREKLRHQFKHAPELNDMNFPILQQNSSPWQGQSYPAASKPGTTKQSPGNLLSASECMSIFNELVTNLSNCVTRADQLRAIGEIALKYIN